MTRVTVGGRSSVSQTGTIRQIGTYAGEFDPASGLPTTGTGRDNAILKGDYWKASGSGTIASLLPFTDFVAGDLIYATKNNASVVADFFGNKASGGSGSIVNSATSAASITPDVDTYDVYKLTAQAEALTINNPTGTPDDLQSLIISVDDDGTARAVSYGAAFNGNGSTLPATTIIGKTLYLPFVWNNNTALWDYIGGSGIDTFLELSDTPSSYSGQGSKLVAVNAGATALEFVSGSSSRTLVAKSVTTASHTGDTNETKIYSVLIAANTFQASDVIKLAFIFSKSGTAGNCVTTIYFNDTDDLTTPTQFAQISVTSNHSYSKISREFLMKTGATQYSIGSNTNQGTDDIGTSANNNSPSIDFTQDQYLVISVDLASAADTISFQGGYIEIIR